VPGGFRQVAVNAGIAPGWLVVGPRLHLAYRWFCRLDLDDKVPHHSHCFPQPSSNWIPHAGAATCGGDFNAFLSAMAREAAAAGVSRSVLDSAFRTVAHGWGQAPPRAPQYWA
jgi:membrane-bound lytic murein transglycosylase B